MVENDTERQRDFTAGDLKPIWDNLERKRIPRGEKVVNDLNLDDMNINENKWRNIDPKKLKIMIGTQDAVVKHLELDALIDKKQMTDLEAEINRNVDTVYDLLNQISTLKKEIIFLISQLSTQAEMNITNLGSGLILHQNEIENLKSIIKIKSNEIRKLKISRALIRSKKNMKKKDLVEKNNEESSDQRSMNRSVKTIMDIMEIESNKNIEKQKEILCKDDHSATCCCIRL